uniref:Nucleoprotein TPR n=2 Tax=Timema TaxID=61471 RepID=A0A7R8VHB2_TIMDO|nr:unnamed protein product [Timema douglasi]
MIKNLERTIESMSPAAAAASRMIKSGLTVTQIYSQYVSASDELLLTKEENKRLNHFINTIIEDIEEKAPYLKKQKEDYARTLLQVESAKTNMDAMLAELQKVTDEGNEAKKTAAFHARENLRLKAELTDVSKQGSASTHIPSSLLKPKIEFGTFVCFLLKEVEQARAGFAGLSSNADVAGGEANSSSRIISEKLVTFGNIEELLLNNQKLLALVRELTSKKEDEEKEKDDLDPQELKVSGKMKIFSGKPGKNREFGNKKIVATLEAGSKGVSRERLEFYVVQFEEMKATMHNYEKMLEALKRQRNMYRNLYQNRSNSDDIEDPMETSPTKTISLPNSPHPAPDSQIDELQKKLLESEKALKELREETDSYRKERQTNDTMMAEQLESLRADLTRLQNSNCKMLAQLEFSEERFKVQQTNAAIYKKQISALEEKNRSYSDTIVKHEYTLLSLRERALASESKLARAEVQLENARHECSLLKEVEVRLQSECEMLRRERQSTSLVLADLDTIKTRLERTDADSRIKMESKLDEANRECSAIRRRLQEEEDRWRALQATLVAQLNSSKTGYEEEKSAADRLREDLAGARKELRSQASQLEELNNKLKEMSLPPTPVDTGSNGIEFETLTKRLNELEARLSRSQSDLSLAQQQLQDARQQTETYREIAESSEIRLKEEMSSIEKYRQDTQNRLLEADSCEAALRKQLQEANTQLARITTGTTQSTTELNAQLIMGRDKLKKIQEELEQKKLELEEAHKNNVELLSSAQEAEEKYSREIVLHSNDIQALAKVREELLTKTNKLDRLEAEKSEAVQALQIGRSNWEERERKLREQLASVEQRLVDLNSQNSVLHDQIQSFSSQLALQQSLTEDSGNISLNRSLNTSLSEEEMKSTEQLVSVIKYLRKEKDIAYGKFEVIRTENLRLKTQLENAEKQLRTAQDSLKAEAEVTDTSVATSAKHAELLRKVDMLNAITDSNRGLREEQSLLQSKVKELTERVKKLNSELEPAMKENREFSTKVEMLSSENSALRGEAGRLRQRVNFLVERSNKASPEDWRRLQQEREMLTKQLATEKELLKKSQDDLKVVRQDKARLEEQFKQQAEEVKRLSEELEQAQQRATRLQQELDSVKSQLLKKNAELATITEDLGAKEALLADIRNKEMQIRKIAKKYKLQYEEKKKAEEIASQSPLSTEVSPEAQEQFRNEGRREVEQRIKENEDRSTDTIKELTDQKGGRIEGKEGWRTLQTRGEGRFGTVVEKSRSSVKAEAELFFPFSSLAEHVVELHCRPA